MVDHQGEIGWAPASHLEPTDDGAEITTSKIFAPGQGKIVSIIEQVDINSVNLIVLLKITLKFARHQHDTVDRTELGCGCR